MDRDLCTERLTELIEAKVEGKEIVAPPEAPEPHVVNLMDALKKSITQVKRPGAAERPARKLAASRTKTGAARRTGRRKTG